jgi:hypothetical protein
MKQRDRLVLAIVAVAGVVGAVWFLALAPKREAANAVTAKITAAELRRDAANQQADVAEQAKSTYRRDYATVARLGKAVPAKADVPSLVYQLESAARAAKVDFRAITVQTSAALAPAPPVALSPAPIPTPAPAPATAGAPATPGAPVTPGAASSAGIEQKGFQFTFQGHFLSLRRLLSEIDRFSRVKGSKVSVSGRLLTIDTVTLNPAAKGLPNIKAEIKANAYVAAVPSALPAASSPQVSGAAATTTTTASEVSQ